jgi:hypothetical protein
MQFHHVAGIFLRSFAIMCIFTSAGIALSTVSVRNLAELIWENHCVFFLFEKRGSARFQLLEKKISIFFIRETNCSLAVVSLEATIIWINNFADAC